MFLLFSPRLYFRDFARNWKLKSFAIPENTSQDPPPPHGWFNVGPASPKEAQSSFDTGISANKRWVQATTMGIAPSEFLNTSVKWTTR